MQTPLSASNGPYSVQEIDTHLGKENYEEDPDHINLRNVRCALGLHLNAPVLLLLVRHLLVTSSEGNPWATE